MSTLDVSLALLARRLNPSERAWFDAARAEIGAGASDDRFCQLISQASRYAPRKPLAPSHDELKDAQRALSGWNPERWSTLEAMRVALVLSHPGASGDGIVRALREAFKYADVGEACALYKSLAHLPSPERFVWQAGEGARSSMRVVFESACCDTPYPVTCFDDTAWRQAVIKCMFIEAPMWRVWGLDTRIDPELARMALDLVEERRSAGRPISPELWMCLGSHAGPRGLAQIEVELRDGSASGRAGAGLALLRAGHRDRLQSLLALENDPLVRQVFTDALAGQASSRAWAALDPTCLSVSGVR
jgi:hypothetical protein